MQNGERRERMVTEHYRLNVDAQVVINPKYGYNQSDIKDYIFSEINKCLLKLSGDKSILIGFSVIDLERELDDN
jgi:hypothetical protein